jgi:hypothetical protein
MLRPLWDHRASKRTKEFLGVSSQFDFMINFHILCSFVPLTAFVLFSLVLYLVTLSEAMSLAPPRQRNQQ